ncbi:MAG: hypothetical protein P1P86_01620 [Bacteroidales bacterium]|nr:hypothetical protein [Bacteroidales bacterium]
MKNLKIYRIFSFALSLLLLATVARAQTQEEKTDRDAELKVKQEQIEMQRQQMKEQQLKTIELERAFAGQAREASRARSSARFFSPGSGFADEGSYYFFSGGQENQSQLTIRNSFTGNSDNSEGEFDVDESTTHIRCTISGKANAGKIKIKVLYPGGKVFKDLSITSSAQISFSQSLSIREEEKNKYVGSWTYLITADKAEGSYTLSFMTH